MTHPTDDAVKRLVATHREFLAFLTRRVGNRAQAEDILQEAFAKGLPRVGDVEPEAVVGWFYRVLRNSLVDLMRRRGVSDASLEKLALELGDAYEPAPDTRNAICQCVGALAKNLKPEYAAAIDAIEIQGVSLAAFADTAGITANNAAVRVHRARESLKKQVTASCGSCAEHGCIDCTCQKKVEA